MKSKFKATVSQLVDPKEYRRQYMAWRRANDPEFKAKQNEYSRAWYHEHKAKGKKSAATTEAEKKRKADKQREYRAAHREETNAKARKRYAEDLAYRAKVHAATKKWRKNEYAKNPDFRKYAALSTAASVAKHVLKDPTLAEQIKAVRNAFKKGPAS